MSLHRFLPCLLLVALSACGGPDPDDAESVSARDDEITDGTPHTGHRSVGLLFLVHANQAKSYCTGTLVGAKTVLTAAHCVPATVAQAYFVVDAAVVGSTLTGEFFAATSATVHPGYTPGQTAVNDVAVVRLADAPAVQPTPIGLIPPFYCQDLTLIGYGVTGSNASDFGTKRIATNMIEDLDPLRFRIDGSGGGEGNACFGDSGGPSLSTIGGVEVVVGITSAGECGSYTVDMRADAYATWITQAAAGDVVLQPNTWHNFGSPKDVNDNGIVSALDVLIVINRINQLGSGPLTGINTALPTKFIDANNDKKVSALDALVIINHINANNPGTALSLEEMELWLDGDVDHDGCVDLADLNAVKNAFGATVTPFEGGDLDGDGAVGLTDLNRVKNHFGECL